MLKFSARYVIIFRRQRPILQIRLTVKTNPTGGHEYAGLAVTKQTANQPITRSYLMYLGM